MQSTQLVQQLLAALKGVTLTQEQIDMGTTTGEEQHAAARQAIAAAEQAQAEPVNQQLLALAKSFGHKVGCAKNAFGEQCTCGADEAIAAAEQAQQAEPLRIANPSPEQLYTMVTGRFKYGTFPWSVVSESGKSAWAAAAAELVFAPNTIMASHAPQPAQQQAVPVAMSLPFFAYDGETGFERFATEAEAKDAAQESIDAYREEAGEGWAEAVENICWGVVLGATSEVELPVEYNGCNGLAGYMKPVDYVLTDAAQPPAVAVPDGYAQRLEAEMQLSQQLAARVDELERQLKCVAVPESWHAAMSFARSALAEAIQIAPLDRLPRMAGAAMQQIDALLAAAPRAADPIKRLIAMHNELLGEYPYCYFELAYTRRTDWMAWLCTKPREDDPERKVLACGQGLTAEEACAEAISAAQKGGEA